MNSGRRFRSFGVSVVLSSVFCASIANGHEGGESHEDQGWFRSHPSLAAELRDRAEAVRASVRPYLPRAKQTLIYDLDDPERKVMDFFPGALAADRGVDLGLMQIQGRVATHSLLRTALSHGGYLQVQSIMSMEDLLRGQEVYSSIRDPGNYAVSIYGDPTGSGPWGWKFEGHHLSLNMTLSGGQIRSTPVFLGANPAEVRGGEKTGLRILASHQDRAFQLLSSLDESQRSATITKGSIGSEIVERGGAITPAVDGGLSGAEMTGSQRAMLLSVIAAYAGMMRGELATADLERIEADGLEKLRFQWRGGQNPSERHYYRIDGPSVVIEFDALVDDPAAGANHVHAVWHDPSRDFGEDLLRAHYEQSHAEVPDEVGRGKSGQ